MMHKRAKLFFTIALVPLDFLACLFAFILAYIIRVKITAKPVAHPLSAILFLKIFLLVIPVWILIFALAGLYRTSSLRTRIEEIGQIFLATLGGTMFLILLDFLSRKPIFPSKAVPIYGWVLSFILVAVARRSLKQLQRYLYKFGVGVRRVLIIGSGPIAARVASEISRTSATGYQLLGVVDSAKQATKTMSPLKVFRSFSSALKALHQVDEVIQADSDLGPEAVIEIVEYTASNNIAYKFIPNQFGLYATHADVGTLAGVPVMEIKKTPLDGWGRVIKRIFDLMGSVAGLMVFSPIFLLCAVAIKLTDEGPIFYRHRRLSRSGGSLYIYKFRTMYQRFCTGEDYGGRKDETVFAKELGRPDLAESFSQNQKLADDPRITPVGRILRRLSLDELPQLINILAGSLSLVGPRPIVPAEVGHYGKKKSTFFALKPGLTGLWQVSGRSDLTYEERVKLDIYYIENWNLLMDVRILLKTLVAIVKRQGAY